MTHRPLVAGQASRVFSQMGHHCLSIGGGPCFFMAQRTGVDSCGILDRLKSGILWSELDPSRSWVSFYAHMTGRDIKPIGQIANGTNVVERILTKYANHFTLWVPHGTRQNAGQ